MSNAACLIVNVVSANSWGTGFSEAPVCDVGSGLIPCQPGLSVGDQTAGGHVAHQLLQPYPWWLIGRGELAVTGSDESITSPSYFPRCVGLSWSAN